MTRRVVHLLTLGATLFAVGRQAALAQQPDTYQHLVGVPLGNSTMQNPLKIKYTLMVNGNPVTQTIEVAGIEKWTYTVRGANETIQAWHARLAGERAAATRAKAQKIVDALNMKFANEFMALKQMATVDTQNRKDSDYPTAPAQDFGRVNWPSGPPTKTASAKAEWIRPEPTKQPGGGGVTRIPGSMANSSGSRGSMGLGTGFPTGVATGLDLNDQPSIVEFGIADVFVATVRPNSNTLDDQVLRALEMQLNTFGLPATYDESLRRLSLNNPVPDGASFVFGNTDAGLDFEFEFATLTIPEPGTATLGMVGLLAVAKRRASAMRRLRG